MNQQNKTFSIGVLAQQAHCQVQTIRYYESIGLMPEPQRSAGNRRLYTSTHSARLQFIRHARDMGFSLDNIGDLLAASDQSPTCESIDSIVQNHLTQVENRIKNLQKLRQNLKSMLCHQQGDTANCKALTTLYDHTRCPHPHH